MPVEEVIDFREEGNTIASAMPFGTFRRPANPVYNGLEIISAN
jgi:hypothetical protein